MGLWQAPPGDGAGFVHHLHDVAESHAVGVTLGESVAQAIQELLEVLGEPPEVWVLPGCGPQISLMIGRIQQQGRAEQPAGVLVPVLSPGRVCGQRVHA